MSRLLAWIQAFAVSIGGPGLFIIAFLDSSILSLPEVNDILIVSMVVRHPERMVFYALMATLGSIAGCFVLYGIGYKGGEAFLRKRFKERHLDRALLLFRRFGLFAIIIPALLPPPAPFKIFVVLAGVARMPPLQFAIAIGIGRGVRYFGEGLLALWYGRQTIEFLHRNGRQVSLILLAVAVGGAIAYALWRRTRPPRP